MSGTGIDRVAVVLPAHDEEAVLPDCLAALRAAATGSPVPVRIVVVLDDCTDASAACVEAVPDVVALSVRARNVGAARAAGMRHALDTGSGEVWLMTTDADSLVPADWISRHLAHAARGADMVVGTVAVADWLGWPAGLAARYERRYARRLRGTGHGHVHGANLGVSAAAYLAAGGFGPLTHGEDRALVRAVRATGGRVLSATDVPVTTSARPVARAPGGFSQHLHSLSP